MHRRLLASQYETSCFAMVLHCLSQCHGMLKVPQDCSHPKAGKAFSQLCPRVANHPVQPLDHFPWTNLAFHHAHSCILIDGLRFSQASCQQRVACLQHVTMFTLWLWKANTRQSAAQGRSRQCIFRKWTRALQAVWGLSWAGLVFRIWKEER